MNSSTLYGRTLQIIGGTEAPATMEVNGHTFPVIAMVRLAPGIEKPLLDIPQISDFSLQLGALEDRLKDPDKYVQTLGEDVNAKINHLCQWLWAHIGQATPAERMRFQAVVAA